MGTHNRCFTDRESGLSVPEHALGVILYQITFTHIISSSMGRNHLHFTDEETEAQRAIATCRGPHS